MTKKKEEEQRVLPIPEDKKADVEKKLDELQDMLPGRDVPNGKAGLVLVVIGKHGSAIAAHHVSAVDMMLAVEIIKEQIRSQFK